MAVSARESAAEQEPAERRPDPRAPGWADVRSTIVTCAHAAELAVTELAGRPDAAAALEMAARTREAFERAVDIGRRWVFDEAVLEAERAAAFEAGRASRCHLELLPGGLPGPR